MNRNELLKGIPNWILMGSKEEYTFQSVHDKFGGKRNLVLSVLDYLVKEKVLTRRYFGRKTLYQINEPQFILWHDLKKVIRLQQSNCESYLKELAKNRPLFHSENRLRSSTQKSFEGLVEELDRLMILHTRLSYAKVLHIVHKKYRKMIQNNLNLIEKIANEIIEKLFKQHKEFEWSIRRYLALKETRLFFRVYTV